MDVQILHFFNGSNNILLDQMAVLLTSGWTWIPLYLVLFYIVMRNNETMMQITLAVMGALVCVALADGITDGIVKPLVARWRPNNDPLLKYTFHVMDGMRGKGFSFFSAHAANTMSVAVFLSLMTRSTKLSVTLVAWSLINCWTRLYLAMHYPSDILCGLLCGAAVGVLVYMLYLRLYRAVSPHIKYISDQYTSTGYEHADINMAVIVMLLTLIYSVLRGLLEVACWE